MPSTRAPKFTPPTVIIPLEERPTAELFTLPDLTPIFVDEQKDVLHISLGQKPADKKSVIRTGKEVSVEDQRAQVEKLQLRPVLQVTPVADARKARVSLHGAVNDDRAEHQVVSLLESASKQAPSFADLWGALYGVWVRRDEHERIPIQIGDSFGEAKSEVIAYLRHTGLAFSAPDAATDSDLLLDRSSFWQGAGAPLGSSWLQSPQPDPKRFGTLTSDSFPNILSFTKGTTPPVLTVHPLRPPKPAPGAVVYSRYIHSVKSHLTLTHINAADPAHFEPYCRWQNSDRVKFGWRESGDDEHHRKYLADRLADPHIMGYVVAWDGQLAGYGEASFNKEDSMAAFVGHVGDYDQGTHLLCGEDKFRGRFRFAQSMVSMKHFCFLREPRTQIVLGEPRADLDIVELLKAYLPQSFRREVELPHKRAVLFELHRDRFFTDGIFY